MAVSNIVKTKRDGTLTLSDGAGTANSITVAYEQGDFNLDIPGPTVNVFLDRGEFGSTPSLRFGDDQPMTGSFTAYLRDVDDATDEILTSLITGRGGATSSWVSTLGANAEVFTLTLLWTIEGTDHGDAADHTITCNYCWVSGSLSDGDPNMLTINFVAYDLYPTCT